MTKVRFRIGNRPRWGILLTGILCFLCCVGAGMAMADTGPEEPGSSEASLLVPESQTGELPSGGGSVQAGPETNPQAAEELPHGELDRAEAEELLTAVFPSALEEPAGMFNGELEIEDFHSDHVAVVDPPTPESSPGLLTSLLPLRTEGAEGEKEAVDLELERAEGEVDPANPLVEVEIPTELSEGIGLPESNVGIELAGGSSERSASVVQGSATFYPNVAPDTDLAVAPTPTGVETFAQLRTAEAPQTQTYHLSLPAGASLKATPEGGAEITQGGELLVVVPPPSAIDAEGSEVPVTLTVADSSISLQVEPQPEAAYPLLVDPVYESYTWMNSNNNTGIYSDWRPASSNEAVFKPSWIGVWNQVSHAGLNLRSYPGAITPGAQANWNYYVPRFFSDYENPAFHERPTSFIRSMTLSQLYFLIEEGSPVHENPYMLVGLWDENKGEFSTKGTRTGAEGKYENQSIPLNNLSEYTDVKNGGIALVTTEATSYPRQAFVGSATVEVTDQDYPEITSLASPSGWLNQTPSPISYTTFDKGLGVYSFGVSQPVSSGGFTVVTTSNQCLGTASNSCPRKVETAGRTIAYEPKSMAQGVDGVRVLVNDPIGHQTSSEPIPIKVDHTAPTLSLSGNLTEQATVGTKLTSYTLNYAAADGDETTPAAATPIGATGTGTGQLQRPFGVAVDAKGNVWIADRENNRVEEFDKTGAFVRQFGATGTGNGQFSDPRGIAVSSAGNVWVTDLANKRVQEFSEKGEFIRKVTYEGGALGQGKMAEPYSVATGPEETLWVGDVGSHRVYEFKENGTFIRAIASAGPLLQETSLTTPAGIAVDRFGDAYVSEQSSSQILELNPSGNYVSKFGSSGTGQGQLSGPVGLAIAASGNVFVADGNNNRIEEFKPDGTFLREFASLGSEAKQLKEPRGLATGAENSLYVADASNHRIAKWTHADKDPQSGVAKVEVKVDGATAKTEAPGCATRNCTLSGSWTLNADNYAAGAHKVEVTTTDGVGITATKTLEVETHGDYAAPQATLSGTMTEEAKLGATRPTYKLKVAATDPGSEAERKSGVASIAIKVDGATVDSTSPGCPAEGCSLTREWTLTSNNYAPGAHNVQAIVTDAAGHATTKTLAITIERDTTAPTLSPESQTFYEAPKGWLEQKKYVYYATSTDTNGYGVVSLEMKIDGKAVATASGTCAAGNCSKSLLGEINMANYSGGAHSGELIATDGAGNWRKRTWTINVDPKGTISTTEAAKTLEAVEDTSESNLVGESAEEAGIEGTVPGLGLEEVEGKYVATGSVAPTTVGSSAGGPMTVEVPPAGELYGCPTEAEAEAEPEPEEPELEECSSSPLYVGGATELVDVNVTPLAQHEGAKAPELIEGNAVVSANTGNESDTSVRPLNEGGMIFTAIRDESAPESYSYRVELAEEQELKLIDDQHAEVYYVGFGPAFAITAEPAHDAIGTTVPTSLTVDGPNTLTLHVHYKPAPGTEPFVFPVVAGTGWQGGFQTTEVEMPTETGEEGEVTEAEAEGPGPGEEWGTYSDFAYGPPILRGQNDPPERAYNFHRCTWNPSSKTGSNEGDPGGKNIPPAKERELGETCHGTYADGYFHINWAISVSGVYEYEPHQWAANSSGPTCRHWGPNEPALVKPHSAHCFPTPSGHGTPRVDVIGQYRFPPGHYNGIESPGQAVCFEMDGVLPDYNLHVNPGEKRLENNFHIWKETAWPEDQCTWNHLEKAH